VRKWFPVRRAGATAVSLAAAILAVVSARSQVLPGGIGAPHHPIRTTSADAQRLFNQGLTLFYGFNREGARQSFLQASSLDPMAAMPFVGLAYQMFAIAQATGQDGYEATGIAANVYDVINGKRN